MRLTKRITRDVILPAGMFLVLCGCSTMAPTYSRPAAPVSSEWPSGDAYEEATLQEGAQKTADVPWEEFFIDEALRKVVAQALENNRDLRVAVLNIERSRALFQIRRAGLFPEIEASAGATIQRVPADLSTSGEATTAEQYSVGLGLVAYELDLFGRVRSLKEQALDQYLATEQARRSVQISLASQVANAWLVLAADRDRLQLARETLRNQQQAYGLTETRYRSGVSSALDLNRAQTSVDTARADVARFTALLAQDLNALNLAVGSTVPDELLPAAFSEAVTLQELAPGLPSDVLLSRPDILQAEFDLMAANANIGAARAAFFPRITLVSSVGFASDELSGLFSGDSFTWSFIPRISIPIFDAGSNRADLEVAEVDRDIAVARYERAIQAAFREVADALAVQGTIDAQVEAQQSLAEANARSYDLSRARYEKGVDSYLSVLDAQRSLYGSQQNLISTRLARLLNRVALYRVLGGGG